MALATVERVELTARAARPLRDRHSFLLEIWLALYRFTYFCTSICTSIFVPLPCVHLIYLTSRYFRSPQTTQFLKSSSLEYPQESWEASGLELCKVPRESFHSILITLSALGDWSFMPLKQLLYNKRERRLNTPHTLNTPQTPQTPQVRQLITLFISLIAFSVFFDISLNSPYYPFHRLFFYPTLSIYGHRLVDSTINPSFYTPFLRILESSPPWNLYKNKNLGSGNGGTGRTGGSWLPRPISPGA